MIQNKFVSLALLTTAVLLNSTPAMASTVEVSGNGADSGNTANISSTRTTVIDQSNSADINNSATVKSATGGNTANENTGGATAISTGDASSTLTANNTANKNIAQLACCGADGFAVKVSGNGADSYNKVNLNFENNISILDTKNLDIRNNFNVKSETGGNRANENTGGDTRITTGDANVTVNIGNAGNIDVITIGVPKVPVTPVVPVLPTPPAVVTPAKAGGVLGISVLPNTGFDYNVIVLATLALVGTGLVLRKLSEQVETLRVA